MKEFGRLGRAGAEGEEMSEWHSTTVDLPIEALNSSHDGEAASKAFDEHRSVGDPSLTIFVKTDAVPPFRFKAGGWELLRSSIELGPAMKARIAENGFFLCRMNDDRSGWTEQTDFLGLKAEGI
jgi:hypothetical protein